MRDTLGSRPLMMLLAFALVLALVPAMGAGPYILHILTLCGIFAVFAAGWNLVLGMAGLKALGHHAFFAIGAYVSALLSMSSGLDPWVTIWLGAAAAAIGGVILSIPILRIKSMPHLAIVSLAFAEVVRITLSNLKETTRGELGLWGIPAPGGLSAGGIELSFGMGQPIGSFYAAVAFFLLVHVGIILLMRTRAGLVILSIRDSELAAESLGVDLTFWKVAIFSISAFIVGLSGAVYAHYILVLTPSAVAGPEVLVTLLAMILVGGQGTLSGPIIGAFVLTLLSEALREVGDLRMVLYGALIILVTLFASDGLVARLRALWRRLGRRHGASPDKVTNP